MKAMVLREFNHPLQLEELEVPNIGAGEVLVIVKACGVCASDLLMVKGVIPHVTLPHILGHQPAGEVAKVGPEVKGFHPGDRVCIHIFDACGECLYCRMGQENNCIHSRRIGHELNGAYAEYVKAPAQSAFKIPDGVSYEEASILSDTVCTPFHALRGKAKVKMGEDVVIMGVGGLGIHAVQIAKVAGTRVIAVDLLPSKLEFAKTLGADMTIDPGREAVPEKVRSFTRGKGADAIIDFVGSHETIRNGLSSLRRGGRLVLVGCDPKSEVPSSPFQIIIEELEISGSHASTRNEMSDVLTLVETGRIRPIISARFPLSEANEAHRLQQGGETLGKIVLIP